MGWANNGQLKPIYRGMLVRILTAGLGIKMDETVVFVCTEMCGSEGASIYTV